MPPQLVLFAGYPPLLLGSQAVCRPPGLREPMGSVWVGGPRAQHGALVLRECPCHAGWAAQLSPTPVRPEAGARAGSRHRGSACLYGFDLVWDAVRQPLFLCLGAEGSAVLGNKAFAGLSSWLVSWGKVLGCQHIPLTPSSPSHTSRTGCCCSRSCVTSNKAAPHTSTSPAAPQLPPALHSGKVLQPLAV